jgi:hypothetical protein
LAEGRRARRGLTDETSCILSRDGTFLDFARSDLLTLDDASVLAAACEGVGDLARTLEVQGLGLGDESFVVDVVSPQVTEEVRPGDVIRGGVHIAH